MSKRLITDDAGVTRCYWCMSDPIYREYHDREWGFPVTNDRRLFEKICLEGFQSGLSWLTILKKRENFREAFHAFDIERVARMTGRDVQKLLRNAGIVRHRGKIESTINNARRAIELIEAEGSLAAFIWRLAPSLPRTAADRRTTWATLSQPTSPQSVALSKDLRKRGWTFVGPTTMHAFMQAMGLFNHHLSGCHARDGADAARRCLRLPV
ncbi:MAG TPA: DNA-3-methyladenine glycosylase I [Phycisphaerales bacterium]|nr:DNA-3-methyladenine glycosylase I [Phycisphaerales bacterium]